MDLVFFVDNKTILIELYRVCDVFFVGKTERTETDCEIEQRKIIRKFSDRDQAFQYWDKLRGYYETR